MALNRRCVLAPPSLIRGSTPELLKGVSFSPLLFNLLVNGLAAAVRRSAPGAQFFPSGFRLPCQLYADDVVIPADSESDLQAALDAVSEWNRKWRFTFSISPTKSAVMIFGPRTRVLSCAVTLAGSSLPIVKEYTYLGVVLTSSLSWLPHVRHLISRGNRLFAQCVSWCRSDRLPVHFAASLFQSYVLPSISWGLEFCLNSSPAIRLLDGALRRWCRHLLGWPSGSPNAAVFLEPGWPDALHLCTERLLSLFWACSWPCLVVNAALCRHSYSKLPCPSWVHGRLTASDCATLWVFPPSKRVRHGASLFHPLCSSLVPDSRRSSSEPIVARPSCCCCFPALSLPSP